MKPRNVTMKIDVISSLWLIVIVGGKRLTPVEINLRLPTTDKYGSDVVE